MSITKAYLDVALFFGKEEYLAAFNNFTFNFLMFLLQRFLVHFHLKKKTLSTSICKNGTDDWRPPVRSLPSFPLRPPSPQFFPYLVLPLKKKRGGGGAREAGGSPFLPISRQSSLFSFSRTGAGERRADRAACPLSLSNRVGRTASNGGSWTPGRRETEARFWGGDGRGVRPLRRESFLLSRSLCSDSSL